MNKLVKIVLIIGGFGLFSCTTQQVEQQHLPIADGRYDSEFPVRSVSDELAFLSTTVRKLDCLVFYSATVFTADNPLNKSNLTEENMNNYILSEDVTNESVSGTVSLIYYDGKQVGLLTCAHILNFPDTLYNYNANGGLRSIAVKLKQQNFVSGLPNGEDVEIVALDIKKDIAILRKVLSTHERPPAVLNYPLGKTKDLEWGTVIYTMGFPLGNLMVTRAIVSDPAKNDNSMFLTDALFNPGISGSPVLALRDGASNFEWVGMASASSAESIHYLKPATDAPTFVAPGSPYSGSVFIDYKKAINYGVTYSVRIDDILKFLSVNKKILQEKGFDTDLFFK